MVATEIPRNGLFGDEIVRTGSPLVIENLAGDARFVGHPMLALETPARFYAGYPLRAPGGEVIGSLCIFDTAPRTFDEADLDTLADLAAMTEGEFGRVELSVALHHAEEAGRLKRKFLIAPVSNGNISLMVDLARRNDFPWDAILGAEVAGDYKPKPRVYLAACAAFDLAPEECMMVAAHSSDLATAAALGLRTGHVARPNEHGPGKGERAPTVEVDVAGRDLGDLADKLGA